MAFDPLDGSSIIDTNFAVGTIFGVWPGSRLVGVSGRDLVGAGMAVYGPRTTITVAGERYVISFGTGDPFQGISKRFSSRSRQFNLNRAVWNCWKTNVPIET